MRFWDKDDTPEAKQRRANALAKDHPEMMLPRRKTQRLVVASKRYQMHNRLLYRKVYDRRNDELQLRCCAPPGRSRAIVTHMGLAPMDFRTELLL